MTTAPIRRPSAEWTTRTIAELARAAAGSTAVVGAAHLTYRVEVPVAGEWLVSLMEIQTVTGPVAVRTVRVRPGEFRAHEAVRTLAGGPLDGAECVIAETHTAEAALGIALEYVTAPW